MWSVDITGATMNMTVHTDQRHAGDRLSVRCRRCDRTFEAAFHGPHGAFARAALQLWPERCSHCGDMAAYARDEYFAA